MLTGALACCMTLGKLPTLLGHCDLSCKRGVGNNLELLLQDRHPPYLFTPRFGGKGARSRAAETEQRAPRPTLLQVPRGDCG